MSKIHPRTKIRKAFAELLIDKTMAKKNVFDSRAKPLFEQNLPALLVYTRDERVLETNYDGDGSMNCQRELELSIEGIVSGSKNIDDTLDQLAIEIEDAIKDFEIPNFLNAVIKLKSTETEVTVEGSKTYGASRLNYTINYFT